MSIDSQRLIAAFQSARSELLARRVPDGYWVGQLASSALSTATAISALAIVERHLPTNAEGVFADEPAEARLSELIVRSLRWLAARQNPDGGWGDTDLSLSNIATTMLVKAAFHLTGVPASHADLLVRSDAYIASHGGTAELKRRYGQDKTFAVPILTNCALAGFVPWKEVPSLPFELACLPQEWFRFLRLPVVSYAIPALVAIGQAKYFHRPPLNPLLRWVRRAALEKSLRLVEQMQPASGGFLEATPLTSFVVMSLASSGKHNHAVTRRGVEFLLRSVRQDGSWPIDTNLATWNTTLALNALAAGETSQGSGFRVQSSAIRGQKSAVKASAAPRRKASHAPSHPAATANARAESPISDAFGPWVSLCMDWLLSCQHRRPHAYTAAKPGGWAWTDLSGGVPDVDDTSGALLALVALQKACGERANFEPRLTEAAALGVRWLLELQNADGGWPTFCRGWGKMPFDRSASDLTAHALRALRACRVGCAHQAAGPTVGTAHPTSGPSVSPIDEAVERGFQFLAKSQRQDGSWVPLWFGNQYHPEEENPLYGTARVLLAYRDYGRLDTPEARRGLQWLTSHQNLDGGWGGVGLGTQAARELRKPGHLGVEASGNGAKTGNAMDAPAVDSTPQPDSPNTQRRKLRLFNAHRTSEHAEKTANGRDKTGEHLHPEEHPQSTVEETALAMEALLSASTEGEFGTCLESGLSWLVEAVETKHFTRCSPIGFYFAKLWYYEQLYPLIFTVSALGQAVRRLASPPQPEPAASLPATQNA